MGYSADFLISSEIRLFPFIFKVTGFYRPSKPSLKEN